MYLPGKELSEQLARLLDNRYVLEVVSRDEEGGLRVDHYDGTSHDLVIKWMEFILSDTFALDEDCGIWFTRKAGPMANFEQRSPEMKAMILNETF